MKHFISKVISDHKVDKLTAKKVFFCFKMVQLFGLTSTASAGASEVDLDLPSFSPRAQSGFFWIIKKCFWCTNVDIVLGKYKNVADHT
jgi:hypothetical protein